MAAGVCMEIGSRRRERRVDEEAYAELCVDVEATKSDANACVGLVPSVAPEEAGGKMTEHENTALGA